MGWWAAAQLPPDIQLPLRRLLRRHLHLHLHLRLRRLHHHRLCPAQTSDSHSAQRWQRPTRTRSRAMRRTRSKMRPLWSGPRTSLVAVFASTSANWLGDQGCHFWGDGSPSCVQFYQNQYAERLRIGPRRPWRDLSLLGGVQLRERASIKQGEDHRPRSVRCPAVPARPALTNGSTPSSQVRPSGPVWLDEGSPEVVGYRVHRPEGSSRATRESLRIGSSMRNRSASR